MIDFARGYKYEPNRYELDTKKLLNGQEILSFDLDHEDSSDMHHICI